MGPNAQTVTSNGAADGICNELLPNDSIYKRFLYVVSALAANGFYVIVDNHISYDSTYQNPAQWAALWAQVRPRPALWAHCSAVGFLCNASAFCAYASIQPTSAALLLCVSEYFAVHYTFCCISAAARRPVCLRLLLWFIGGCSQSGCSSAGLCSLLIFPGSLLTFKPIL